MLSSTTGLLRAACLQSHSHPLQCKALELCFNVALNRLPASTTSTPMLNPHQNHHHHHHPSLSNALVAAFKRAQAHQRRGSIESQQQPLLAIKIEIEQLIISILDDPSVSRVMREAGFSSTQVKTNVEHALSLDMCSPSPSSSSSSSAAAAVAAANSRKSKQESFPTPPHPCAKNGAPAEQIKTEDVMSVMDCLTNKKRRKRSVVVVGECLATVEGVVRGVMDKAERGEGPELLRNVQFINLPIFSFSHLSKEEVEHKVAELRCLVKSCCMGRGAVLYLGDLRWAAEYRTSCTGEKGRNYYCPVEHVIMEVGRLASWRMEGGEYASQGRFWIMGVATYQTYNKCRNGHPSLETLWSLHPLTIPAGSLELSLSFESDLKNPLTSHGNVDGGDCGSLASNLPSWLQQYKGDKRVSCPNDQGESRTRDICERWKWNSICGSSAYKLSNHTHSHSHSHSHQPLLQEKTLNFSLVSSASISSSHDQACPSRKVHHFLTSDSPSDEGEDRRNPQSTSPNPKPDAVNSTTSSDTMEVEHHRRFKELNAENHKILCNALEEKVPWQTDVIPAITSTILQCRSGMTRRKDKSSSSIKAKEDTWLLFQGCDSDGKETVSRELAALIFGSNSNIAMIGLNDFAQTRGDSTDAASSRCKRSRSEMGLSYLDRFVEAIKRNPHRVFLLDDVQQLDPRSCLAIKGAVERGTIRGSDGEEVQIEDAIVVLSCETLDARSRACSPQVRQRQDYDREKEASECEKDGSSSLSLDLNLSAEGQEEEEDEVEQCNRLAESVDRTFFFNMRTQT